MDRRAFIGGMAGLTLLPATSLARADGFSGALLALRTRLGPGGRLGVAASDGRQSQGLDQDSRYAMASTFKLPLAAAMLAGADRRRWSLDEPIRFSRDDLVPHAPTVEAHLAAGRLSIARLCYAIVVVSDNAAANLLLRRIGGPAALTAFVRSCGDGVTRLDRFEPELNSNLPEDPRDTTSPAAMAGLVHRLLFGEMLSAASRARLLDWMERCATGRDRLRAGLPGGSRMGDKTGTGANGAHNDVAFAIPASGSPLVIASYISGGDASPAVRAEVHAGVARLVAAAQRTR